MRLRTFGQPSNYWGDPSMTDINSSNLQDGGDTGFAGGNSAHNNLQPYLCIYIFKRTA